MAGDADGVEDAVAMSDEARELDIASRRDERGTLLCTRCHDDRGHEGRERGHAARVLKPAQKHHEVTEVVVGEFVMAGLGRHRHWLRVGATSGDELAQRVVVLQRHEVAVHQVLSQTIDALAFGRVAS